MATEAFLKARSGWNAVINADAAIREACLLYTSGKNFIVVKERFSLTHNNDIAYPFLEILLDESHLSDDFCSREIPGKAFLLYTSRFV